MPRKVFYSFHFDNDFWRAQQVRNINAFEGQALATPNDWESLKRTGDDAIKRWINSQLEGKTCLVCLVGSDTANRPWVQHEISTAWNVGKGVVAVRIHQLLDRNSQASLAGDNPLNRITFTGTTNTLASVAQLKAPSGYDSKGVYSSICGNLESWIEEAIEIRKKHG